MCLLGCYPAKISEIVLSCIGFLFPCNEIYGRCYPIYCVNFEVQLVGAHAFSPSRFVSRVHLLLVSLLRKESFLVSLCFLDKLISLGKGSTRANSLYLASKTCLASRR